MVGGRAYGSRRKEERGSTRIIDEHGGWCKARDARVIDGSGRWWVAEDGGAPEPEGKSGIRGLNRASAPATSYPSVSDDRGISESVWRGFLLIGMAAIQDGGTCKGGSRLTRNRPKWPGTYL